MKAQQPVAATITKWLRANGQNLGALTGTDYRALRAAVSLVELYSLTGSRRVAQAFGVCVLEMGENSRHLAYHSIAHVMDWGDRPMLWALAGLAPLQSIPVCTYGPGGKGGAQ